MLKYLWMTANKSYSAGSVNDSQLCANLLKWIESAVGKQWWWMRGAFCLLLKIEKKKTNLIFSMGCFCPVKPDKTRWWKILHVPYKKLEEALYFFSFWKGQNGENVSSWETNHYNWQPLFSPSLAPYSI